MVADRDECAIGRYAVQIAGIAHQIVAPHLTDGLRAALDTVVRRHAVIKTVDAGYPENIHQQACQGPSPAAFENRRCFAQLVKPENDIGRLCISLPEYNFLRYEEIENPRNAESQQIAYISIKSERPLKQQEEYHLDDKSCYAGEVEGDEQPG